MPRVTTKIDPLNKPAPRDWHKADIKCALEKRGYTFFRLSRLNGYADTSIQMVIHHPWPKAERIVAAAIGVPPQQIWPSRYHEDGTPKSGRNERGLGDPRTLKRRASRPASNHTSARQRRNVKARAEI